MPLPGSRKSKQSGGGIGAAGGEFVQMVIDYAKQETLGPLKGLARFVAFGLAGSIALSIGLLLLLLGLLRLLQSETGSTFTGKLSWLPYVITTAAAVIIAVLAALRIKRGPAARRADAADGTRRP
jgi:hypothetical protein